jgi:beta-N-acetylglucosaminidase/uncharacterized protein YraI
MDTTIRDSRISWRKAAVIIISTMIVFLSIPFTANSEASASSKTCRTTVSVNLRKGPGLSYKKVGLAKKGTSLKYIKKAGVNDGFTWYKVKHNGRKCYIASNFVTFSNKTVTNNTNKSNDKNGSSSYITKSGFPSSYLDELKKLHAKHPNWKFTPVMTGLSWDSAFAQMTKNPGTNTINSGRAPSYKLTDSSSYNYLTDTYYSKDSAYFVAASKSAVAYYMDPRNWLTETYIYMFEDRTYHSYQTEEIVKKTLKNNPTLAKASSSFVSAGKKYNVSPVYLAAKSYTELGTGSYMIDGHKFTYNGVKYKNCYNAFNIGACDSYGGGAVKGLVYANGGQSSKNYTAGSARTYGRKWDTLDKAIDGGTAYLKSSFTGNNQANGYTEHFNVLNGLSAVGTHVYMTAVYAPASMTYQVANSYKKYGIDDEALEFFIPVYNNMPANKAYRPSDSSTTDNNYYLRSLRISAGGRTKTLIKSTKCDYRTVLTADVPSDSDKVKITASAASKNGAYIPGTGTHSLRSGSNTFNIIVRSTSGLKRIYTVVIRK